MSRLALLSLLLLCACATPVRSPGKLSFEDAFQPPPAEPPRPKRRASPRPRPAEPPRDSPPDGYLVKAADTPELEAALASFINRARAYRELHEQGSPMPYGQVENWLEVSQVVDQLLRQMASRTPPKDIARARVALEAEFRADARAYGDIPASVADAVTARVARLARRMVAPGGRRWAERSAPRTRVRLAWPVQPVSVTSLYGLRRHPMTGRVRPHQGVDLAAERGQAIYSAAPGVVLTAGWNGSHGLQVEVQHAGGVLTRYSHLSQVLVEPGEIMQRGSVVGLAGDTGLATGVHLHFELWKDGQPCDPLDELEAVDEPEYVSVLGPAGATTGYSSAPWPGGSPPSWRP